MPAINKMMYIYDALDTLEVMYANTPSSLRVAASLVPPPNVSASGARYYVHVDRTSEYCICIPVGYRLVNFKVLNDVSYNWEDQNWPQVTYGTTTVIGSVYSYYNTVDGVQEFRFSTYDALGTQDSTDYYLSFDVQRVSGMSNT